MTTDLLAAMSEWTWHFLRDAQFRPREETITESLLVDLKRRGRGRVWVYKATTQVESRAGLDWALALKTSGGWVTMLVQAKNADGRHFARYPELRKSDAAEQARDLIHAAAMARAVPVYAFYHGEIKPFGRSGQKTAFGACPRSEIKRGDGLPWVNTTSALGISVAHAEDVLDFVIPPPSDNQRATSVNHRALPLECLLCPAVVTAPHVGDVPRIRMVAEEIAHHTDAAGAADIEPPGAMPSWIHLEMPDWVAAVMEGIEPRVLAEDAPDVSYFVIMNERPDDQPDAWPATSVEPGPARVIRRRPSGRQ